MIWRHILQSRKHFYYSKAKHCIIQFEFFLVFTINFVIANIIFFDIIMSLVTNFDPLPGHMLCPPLGHKFDPLKIDESLVTTLTPLARTWKAVDTVSPNV